MKIVKGFRDILPYGNKDSDSTSRWNNVNNQLRQVMSLFNFEEIITPVIEYDSTFKTGIGEDTDIVSKEMYEFKLEKDNESKSKSQTLKYCLRPEGTAPIVRSVVENSLNKIKSINKLFYLGPMFRYERSQKGRYRMFHQVGAELIGSGDILYEIEILNLALNIIKKIDIEDFTFEINSIGNKESLINISNAVIEFGKKNQSTIDKDDYKILEKNPLRFLDKAINKYDFDNIPKTLDYLDKKSLDRFKDLTKILDKINFPYKINSQLVRGIDYYNDLVFEVTSKNLGAQNTILAGGRYDSLFEKFGTSKINSIGFAAGIERLILAITKEIDNKNKIDYFIAYKEKEMVMESLTLALKLREVGFKVEIDLEKRSFIKQMKLADKSSTIDTIIISKDDFKNSLIKIKNMNSGKETLENINDKLKDFKGKMD